MKRSKALGLLAGLLGLAGILYAAGTQYPYFIAPFRGMGSRNNTVEFAVQVPSAGAAAIFAPGTTNTNALGSTSLRFSNVFTQLLNVAGTATVAVSSNTTSTTTPFVFFVPTLDVTVTTPTVVGQMGVTSAGKVYVATTTVDVNSWKIVGTQS